MGDYSKKLAKKAAEDLEPGEQLHAASRALAPGALKSISFSAGGAVGLGAAGVMAADAATSGDVADGKQQAEAMELPLATQMALAVTDSRLMVYSRSALTGRAKDLLGSVPLDRIESMTAATGKMKDSLTLAVAGGESIELDIVKVDGAEPLATAFSRATGR